ncbi:hypothetical protein CJF42_03575 [Pseudoalteromonas sp. NBT06-2]|uniref:hypothetical protein n=1 Tax=Pseudoalteromonas sp. NBT06-2 TaxID=2025950 RepID=UPI000BA4F137|nr:hypothetical protein [Pseudoalteromonas sp. NBT06-2]PAJ75723.1 hypothetical protein CJF42_03575 [Pseudoalteromonas sp. NBT06-2]
MSKYLIVSILSLFLVACGGGGSDSDSGSNGSANNGGNSGGMTYVTGEFKSADITGLYAPSDPSAFGDFGECHSTFNRHYFESANAMVYGDPSLPDDDYKHAASLVEGQLQTAYSKTGFSEAEFKELRPAYSVEVQRLTIIDYLVMHYVQTDGELDELDITDVDSEFSAPENWNELEDNERVPLVTSYWNSISKDKQTEFIQQYEALYNFDLVGHNTIPEKVVVCLDARMNSSMWGQGTLLGMNIAPNSVAGRSDSDQVVLHELIHWIQLNVSTPVEPTIQIHGRWFIEGMATYLAGQQVAKEVSGFYPVNVVTHEDENANFNDPGVAYGHYSKAFSYLYENSGPERIKELLLKMRYSTEVDRYAFSGESSNRFSYAFDEFMLKKNGERLMLEEFRNNYHSLVE